MDVKFEGYLHKRARKSGRNWKKRYFQLVGDCITYREAPGKKEKGRLLLTQHSKVVASDIDKKKQHVLQIICNRTDPGSDTLYVSASSTDEFEQWRTEIQIVTSQLQDRHLSTQTKVPGPPPAGSLSSIPGPPPPAALPGPPPSLSSGGETKSNRARTGPPTNTKMYAWGANECGQIGQSQSSLQNTADPKHVEALKRKNAPAFAACGLRHTVAVTVSGMLFGFGEGGEGQLGCGDRVERSSRPYLLASVRNKDLNRSHYIRPYWKSCTHYSRYW